MNALGTAVVRFRTGRAITLVFADHLTRTSDGRDDTRVGWACFPGSTRFRRVHRIGHGYWKQLGAK